MTIREKKILSEKVEAIAKQIRTGHLTCPDSEDEYWSEAFENVEALIDSIGHLPVTDA